MQSSVLGKRTQSFSDTTSCSLNIPTPETTPNPKRFKTSTTLLDVHPDCNKENIPPLASTPTTFRRASTSIISTHDRRTPRRHSSGTHLIAPATSLAHLSLATPPPTPPTSITPIHVRARGLLRPTSNGASPLSGRSAERDVITDFITSFVESESSDQPSSLYISGSPGTGKTALVNTVLGGLDASLTVININCMALNDIEALWERIIDELSVKKIKVEGKIKRLAVVNQLLSNIFKCVLVLDELDHITTSPKSLNSLFSLSHSNASHVRIIGIANTHTLTSSSSQLDSASVKTLHFSPYSPEQLLEILNIRLAPLFNDEMLEKAASAFLPVPSLTLLTKKIASRTGDVRALFEVLRGAIDLSAVAGSQSKSNPLNSSIVVSPAHVLSALKAYTPSPTNSSASAASGTSEVVSKVRNLGLHARFLLLSLSLAYKRIESNLALAGACNSSNRYPSKRPASVPLAKTSVDVGQLHSYYTNLLVKSSGVFTPVSRSEFGDIIGMLETLGLISPSFTSSSSKGAARKGLSRASSSLNHSKGASKSKSTASTDVSFTEGVRMDEVARGLGVEQQSSNSEVDDKEELRLIWDQETREIRRLASVSMQSKSTTGEGFEDMVEY